MSRISYFLMESGTETAKNGRVKNSWPGCTTNQRLRMMWLSMTVGEERPGSIMEDIFLLNMIHPLARSMRNSLNVGGKSVEE